MNQGRTNFVSIFVCTVLLLLPIAYVGTYLVALRPGFIHTNHFIDQLPPECFFPYRWSDPLVGKVFWPLEKIDRRLRSSKWEDREVPTYLWSSTPFGKDNPHWRLQPSKLQQSPFDD